MGLFNTGKKPEPFSISGKMLLGLLDQLVCQLEKEVNSGLCPTGPEILFDYMGKTYTMGVNYEIRAAEKAGAKEFSAAWMHCYFDHTNFNSAEALKAQAELDGEKVCLIPDGILLFPEFASMLQSN